MRERGGTTARGTRGRVAREAQGCGGRGGGGVGGGGSEEGGYGVPLVLRSSFPPTARNSSPPPLCRWFLVSTFRVTKKCALFLIARVCTPRLKPVDEFKEGLQRARGRRDGGLTVILHVGAGCDAGSGVSRPSGSPRTSSSSRAEVLLVCHFVGASLSAGALLCSLLLLLRVLHGRYVGCWGGKVYQGTELRYFV